MMSEVHSWVSLSPTLQPCFSCTTLSHGDSGGPSSDTWIVVSGQYPEHTIMCKVSKQSRGHLGWQSSRLIVEGGFTLQWALWHQIAVLITQALNRAWLANIPCKSWNCVMPVWNIDPGLLWVEDDLGTNSFVLCLLSWIYCDIIADFLRSLPPRKTTKSPCVSSALLVHSRLRSYSRLVEYFRSLVCIQFSSIHWFIYIFYYVFL